MGRCLLLCTTRLLVSALTVIAFCYIHLYKGIKMSYSRQADINRERQKGEVRRRGETAGEHTLVANAREWRELFTGTGATNFLKARFKGHPLKCEVTLGICEMDSVTLYFPTPVTPVTLCWGLPSLDYCLIVCILFSWLGKFAYTINWAIACFQVPVLLG